MYVMCWLCSGHLPGVSFRGDPGQAPLLPLFVHWQHQVYPSGMVRSVSKIENPRTCIYDSIVNPTSCSSARSVWHLFVLQHFWVCFLFKVKVCSNICQIIWKLGNGRDYSYYFRTVVNLCNFNLQEMSLNKRARDVKFSQDEHSKFIICPFDFPVYCSGWNTAEKNTVNYANTGLHLHQVSNFGSRLSAY